MHHVGRQLHSGGKTERGHAKPKEFAPEEENDGADERADDGDGKVVFQMRHVGIVDRWEG